MGGQTRRLSSRGSNYYHLLLLCHRHALHPQRVDAVIAESTADPTQTRQGRWWCRAWHCTRHHKPRVIVCDGGAGSGRRGEATRLGLDKGWAVLPLALATVAGICARHIKQLSNAPPLEWSIGRTGQWGALKAQTRALRHLTCIVLVPGGDIHQLTRTTITTSNTATTQSENL